MNINGYIDKRQCSILLNSQTVLENPQYSWLVDFLKAKNVPSITVEEFENFTDEQKAMIDGTLYEDLYTNSCNEWIQVDYDEPKETELPSCSLCGEPNIKKVYYIENKKNKIKFSVGSTCIDVYKNLKSIDGKDTKEIIKQSRIHSKKLLLNKRFPGIIDKIEKYNDFINNLPIYIHKKLYEEYMKIHIELYELYEKFLKKNKTSDLDYLSKGINTLVNKSEILKVQIIKFIDNQRELEWRITPEIKKWCENTGAVKAKKLLMEDGKLTFRNVYYIYEKELMQKVVSEFKKHLIPQNLEIVYFDILNKCISFKSAKNKNIVLKTEYLSVFDKYGEFLFEDSPFNIEFDFILQNSIINDENSLYNGSIYLGSLCKNAKLSLLSNDTDIDKNVVNFLNYDDDNVYILGLKDFVNEFKELFFKDIISIEEKDKLKKYILTGTKQNRKSYNEYKNIFSNNVSKRY